MDSRSPTVAIATHTTRQTKNNNNNNAIINVIFVTGILLFHCLQPCYSFLIHPSPSITRKWTTRSSEPIALLDSLSSIDRSDKDKSGSSSSSSNNNNNRLKVGITGAGAIALATAALLVQNGHDPMLWSPSGKSLTTTTTTTSDSIPPSSSSTKDEQEAGATITATGTMFSEDISFLPRIAKSAKQLAQENDILIIAIPANGHKYVMDLLAPYIQPNQHIIISSHSSLGAIYFSQRIQDERNKKKKNQQNENNNSIFHEDKDDSDIPITAWGTTVITARKQSNTAVNINTVRTMVDLCTVPNKYSQTGYDLCNLLFNNNNSNKKIQFRLRDGLLAISLSNVNPQNHLGIALGNMSRMEKKENWYQLENVTPNIGRFLESLDKERLSIADELKLGPIKSIHEHFSLSFHVPDTNDISDMCHEIYKQGKDVYGPNTSMTRYILEDIPYGITLTIILGNLVNRPAILHQAGLQIISSMYNIDFYNENDMLNSLNLNQYTLRELQNASYTGKLMKLEQTGEETVQRQEPGNHHHNTQEQQKELSN